jgi:hypothetical protein
MSLATVTGRLDANEGIVLPNNTGTWADLSGTTWDSWNTWINKPANPLVWLTNVIDLGSSINFNLKITTVANGEVSYTVYTSDTGAFAGEESATDISHTATGVPGFKAQYCMVAVRVTKTMGLNTLTDVQVTANDSRINVLLSAVDTSTLSGSTSARTLVLPRTVSKIIDMIITPHELASAYTLDLYVSSTQTSKQLVPKIVSKSISTPQISLTGLDNQPRNGVVDISIWALPEMYMDGNNLTTR